MINKVIVQQRLYNQHISRQVFKEPAEIVRYMGAIQAQDYAGAKWAVGLRLLKSNDADVDKALAEGAIIRTHVLRPTWHFVCPDDLRGMLDLSASRIVALAASRYRTLKLDAGVFKKSHDALAKALEGGRYLSRPDIAKVLQQAGVEINEERFVHLLMQAELDKVICSGPREGKQFTYAFFDDRVPGGGLSRAEALAKLVRQYLISRGPATLHDFAWWSGLTLADAKAGVESVKEELENKTIDGVSFWMQRGDLDAITKTPLACLLPAYDEYAVAYADRNAIINPKFREQTRHIIFDPSIIINGSVAGTWKRRISTKSVNVDLNLFGDVSKKSAAAIQTVLKRYEKFVK